MRFFLPLIAALLFLSGCVSNKKIQLLHKDDVNTKALPKDSIMRSYALDTFNYRIQANDILSVKFESRTARELDVFATTTQQTGAIQGNPLLMGDIVDENGFIPFPVVGKVQVSGLTVFQIQDKLQAMANQYVESPVVKVRLLNYRITILGEVKEERSITLTNNRVSMLEAIGLAGGMGELADRTNVKLIRQHGGKAEVQYLNFLDEDFIQSPYYYVYQNDVLIVPPLKQRPFRNYFGQNLALFVSSVSVLLLAFNLLQQ
jgi:polysaccharide export outer membrane protein